jgi:hypothetical protein
MSANTFTQKQILSGIRIVWREELNFKSSFDPETRIDAQVNAEGDFDDFDIAELICALQWIFNFTCPRKDWEIFFGCHCRDVSEWEKTGASRCTFRGLADFIGERLNPVSLEPLTLLGKPCLTAGIFRGLEQLAVQVNPRVVRFAPSTSIRQCLHGVRLRRFWNRLRWMIEDQIPPPPRLDVRSEAFFNSLLLKFIIPLLIAGARRDWAGMIVAFIVSFVLLIPIGVMVEFINARLNPLPEGIETFGDLARILAAIILDQQTEAASCSTP